MATPTFRRTRAGHDAEADLQAPGRRWQVNVGAAGPAARRSGSAVGPPTPDRHAVGTQLELARDRRGQHEAAGDRRPPRPGHGEPLRHHELDAVAAVDRQRGGRPRQGPARSSATQAPIRCPRGTTSRRSRPGGGDCRPRSRPDRSSARTDRPSGRRVPGSSSRWLPRTSAASGTKRPVSSTPSQARSARGRRRCCTSNALDAAAADDLDQLGAEMHGNAEQRAGSSIMACADRGACRQFDHRHGPDVGPRQVSRADRLTSSVPTTTGRRERHQVPADASSPAACRWSPRRAVGHRRSAARGATPRARRSRACTRRGAGRRSRSGVGNGDAPACARSRHRPHGRCVRPRRPPGPIDQPTGIVRPAQHPPELAHPERRMAAMARHATGLRLALEHEHTRDATAPQLERRGEPRRAAADDRRRRCFRRQS